MAKKFLTEIEASEMLGIRVQTLRSWRFQRRVLPFVKLGKNVRYSICTIDAYMKKNVVAVDAA